MNLPKPQSDTLKAFLQIHLTHKAFLLTTFNSHRGRLPFLRIPFGAKMSQDVFQLWMDAILQQCPGVIGIHDDMVMFGLDQEDHDTNLKCVPERSHTKQQETGTLKRESHLLWSRVQCPGHASRPVEGTGDHRYDSANRQATLSAVPRHGKLHRDLHSKPITSHRATQSDA